MDTNPDPQSLGLTYLLPRDTYWQLINTLRTSLPAPVNDTPEALARRDNAAIADVASMLPANASEATLAAQFVAAAAHAHACLRLAGVYPASIELGLKCRARSASMMREAQGARRLLMRVQAERRKLESDSAALDRAAWTEHCVAGLMSEALPGAPHPALADPPPPPPEPPDPDDEPVFDPVFAAEEYARLYPDRAALIRRLGRLPDNVTFGPPEDRVVRALVSVHTPALLALDREYA